MTKAKNTLYMHTLNGKPAFYDKEEGLIFYAQNDQASLSNAGKRPLFRSTLEQIRREQKIDIDTMKRYGLTPGYKGIVGYLRVRII